MCYRLSHARALPNIYVSMRAGSTPNDVVFLPILIHLLLYKEKQGVRGACPRVQLKVDLRNELEVGVGLELELG